MYHVNILVSITDQNFYLVSRTRINAKEILDQLKKENLLELLKLAVDNTDILKRRFRHCAGRGLLIIRNYKGTRKSVGRQQVSSQILINACKRVSKNFPIFKEAQREVLEDLMDIKHTELVVAWIKDGKLQIKEIETQVPSPFALNLIARGYSDIMRAEDRLAFIKRMHSMILAKIGQRKK
jgi:ATP-dependent Lhr-like helicase